MAEISIQVMEPAVITLPEYISQAAFINRSYIPLYHHEDTSSYSPKEVFVLDTIMNNRIFMGLRDGLNESPLFDLDSIHIIQSRRNDTVGFLKPLKSEQLDLLAQRERAEALISLEYYEIRDTISLSIDYMDFIAFRQVASRTVWRVYDLKLDSVLDEFIMRDTVDWISFGQTKDHALANLPEFVSALRIAGYNAGHRYSQRISPAWYAVPRFYHTAGGKAMKKAAQKAAAQDWIGASDIWENLAYQENSKAAARACFNMALVYEMEDLFIPALDWAVKSYLIKQDPVTMEYIELLKDRYDKQEVIESQLPSQE
jgi:hypothetical protein